jgi:hypothetical protein
VKNAAIRQSGFLNALFDWLPERAVADYVETDIFIAGCYGNKSLGRIH